MHRALWSGRFCSKREGREDGGCSSVSLSKQRKEKGEGLGASVHCRLEKMGLGPGRRVFVGAGREVADTGPGTTALCCRASVGRGGRTGVHGPR
jgi:hypothetical protein